MSTYFGRSLSWAASFAVALALALALIIPTGAPAQTVIAGDSLLLRELRAAALSSSPTLAARRAAVLAAEARVAAAGLLGPAILSAEVDEIPGADVAAASFRLDLSREIGSGRRRNAARSVALVDIDIARIALRTAERMIESHLNASLSRTVAAVAVARRLAAEDSLLLSASETLTDRFATGDARYVDVLRLQTERLRVQTERAQAVAAARAGRIALLALGAPTGDGTAVSIVDSVLAKATHGEIVVEPPAPPALDSLLATAGVLLTAEAEVRRSHAEADLVAAEQRTRIEAGVGMQRFGGSDGDARIGPVIGGSMTLPFTARRTARANALVATRELQAAEARHRSLSAAVQSRLTIARERFQAARERIVTFDEALLRAAREERESALASYRTGDISLLELLDFERSLARAEIEQLQAITEAAAALAELHTVAAGETTNDFPLSGENR